MKNIVDKKSASLIHGDKAKRLLFVYRLTTDKATYQRGVQTGVNNVLETGRSVHVFLVFVKGISAASAEEVVGEVTDRLSGVGKFYDDVFIRVSPFIDITMETIVKLEADVSREAGKI